MEKKRVLVAVGQGGGMGAYEFVGQREGWEVISIDRSKFGLEEILVQLKLIQKEKQIDLVTTDGLTMIPVATYCRERGIPVFGVHEQTRYIEQNKDVAKEALKKHGVPVSKCLTFASVEDFVDRLEEAYAEIGFPCYMKSLNGFGFKTSYRVERPSDVAFLVKRYDYKSGFLLEEMQKGQELGINYMINEKGAEIVGCVYDTVPDNEVQTSTIVTWLEDEEYRRIFPLDALQKASEAFGKEGFRGSIGFTGLWDEDTETWTCIETNTRLGYCSELAYMYNVGNIAEMLWAVGNGEEIPKAKHLARYGASLIVHAKYVDETGYPVGVVDPDEDVVYVENNVHDGVTNGNAPYWIGSCGDDAYALTDKVYNASRKVSLPLKAVDRMSLDVFKTAGLDKLGGA